MESITATMANMPETSEQSITAAQQLLSALRSKRITVDFYKKQAKSIRDMLDIVDNELALD